MTKRTCYIGLMSGTSVDAVDAVAAAFDDDSEQPTVLATHSEPADPALRSQLLALSENPRLTPGEFGALDQRVGDWFADAATALMQKTGLSHRDVNAIGSHGQTIWHAPDAQPAFSLQIGAAPRIAARTGCAVVSDFRAADIAAGGQGAPLVCAFHAAIFGHPHRPRIAINIGGIANLTLLPAGCRDAPDTIAGFDTGPGNGLMDAWTQRHLGQPYDTDGAWAATGTVDDALLERLLADSYFTREPPKSTGREYFNLAWLDARIETLARRPRPANVQATLRELTARTVAEAVARYGPGGETIYLCGGGVRNGPLVETIRARCAPRAVDTTQSLGLDPDWLEAVAFAWLARQRVLGRPGNVPTVTGASRPAVLGGWHAAPGPTAPHR